MRVIVEKVAVGGHKNKAPSFQKRLPLRFFMYNYVCMWMANIIFSNFEMNFGRKIALRLNSNPVALPRRSNTVEKLKLTFFLVTQNQDENSDVV